MPSGAPSPQPWHRRVTRRARSATRPARDLVRTLRVRSDPIERSRRVQLGRLASSAGTAATAHARRLRGTVARLRPATVPRLGRATVNGRSMEPTLHEGDQLLVLWGGPIVPGRISLVRLPDSPGGPRPISVKRVSGPEADRPGYWWIERDNPREGVDSWQVGGIPSEDVAALVLARLPALPALRGSLRRLTRGRLG